MMTGAVAFLKKEFREIFRTYKIYVIPVIFLAIGLMSPIVAKVTPELVQSMTKGQGISIQLPPPLPMDAYLQLFKNHNQLVVLAVIFCLIGLVAEEKIKGSTVLIMTKPVPRWSFIVSKYLANATLVVVSMLLSYLACLYYTVIIFKDAVFAHSAQAAILMLGYYLLLMALTLLCSTMSKSVALSGAASVGGWIILSLLPVFGGWLAKYTPATLSGYENEILKGTKTFAEAAPALLVTLGLAVLLVLTAVWVFKRQEL